MNLKFNGIIVRNRGKDEVVVRQNKTGSCKTFGKNNKENLNVLRGRIWKRKNLIYIQKKRENSY